MEAGSKPEPIVVARLRGYAGLAALVLGVVYGWGALIKATELQGADQSVYSTLPLIPLEQILVTGIGRSLFPLAFLVVIVLLVTLDNERRERRKSGYVSDAKGMESPPTSQERSPSGDPSETVGTEGWLARNFERILWAVGIVGGVYAVLVSEPAFLVVGVYFLILLWLRWPPYVPYARWVTVSLAAFAAATVTLSYFDPRPLPEAKLVLNDGRSVEGGVIAITGEAWYLASGDRTFQAILAADVERSLVTSVDEPRVSLFEELTGWELPGTPGRD